MPPNRTGLVTWLKLGEEFVTDVAILELSDAAFRTHVEGLSCATDRENDGIFTEREVRRFAESPDAEHASQELIDKAVWLRRADGKLQIVHHMAEQPAAEYLRDKRQADSMRQRRHRETVALEATGLTPEAIESVLQERGISPSAISGKARRGRAKGSSGTRDVARDTTRDPERNGKERNGAVKKILVPAIQIHPVPLPRFHQNGVKAG